MLSIVFGVGNLLSSPPSQYLSYFTRDPWKCAILETRPGAQQHHKSSSWCLALSCIWSSPPIRGGMAKITKPDPCLPCKPNKHFCFCFALCLDGFLAPLLPVSDLSLLQDWHQQKCSLRGPLGESEADPHFTQRLWRWQFITFILRQLALYRQWRSQRKEAGNLGTRYGSITPFLQSTIGLGHECVGRAPRGNVRKGGELGKGGINAFLSMEL